MRYRINHPMANRMSVIDHHIAYSGKGTSELAFFQGRKWVTEPIPEFAAYHDNSDSDTAVYGWVPNKLVEEFLEKYQA